MAGALCRSGSMCPERRRLYPPKYQYKFQYKFQVVLTGQKKH